MLNEDKIIKFKKMFSDEEVVRKYIEIEDPAEIKKLFIDHGLDVSDEELIEILELATQQLEGITGEMTETQMEDVAGGFVGWIIGGAIVGTVGGVLAYKMRKHLNSLRGHCK